LFKRHNDKLIFNIESIITIQTSLSPLFITGIIDGEGYFSFSINKNNKSQLGWTIAPRFGICMHIRDLKLIKDIQTFFKVGTCKQSRLFCSFDVNSIKELEIIIDHFKHYPLQSSKRYAFYIFLTIFNIYKNKEHLTREGFLLAIAYINILNKNIKQDVIVSIIKIHGSLPNLILPPVQYIDKIINPNPWWINGFIVGEGSFTYFKRTRSTISGIIKTDYTLVFEVSQKTEDSYLLIAILNFFGVGTLFTEKKGISRFRITSVSILYHIILPYFNLFPLLGFKKKQYDIWLKAVCILISNKNWSKEREELLTVQLKKLSMLTNNKNY